MVLTILKCNVAILSKHDSIWMPDGHLSTDVLHLLPYFRVLYLRTKYTCYNNCVGDASWSLGSICSLSLIVYWRWVWNHGEWNGIEALFLGLSISIAKLCTLYDSSILPSTWVYNSFFCLWVHILRENSGTRKNLIYAQIVISSWLVLTLGVQRREASRVNKALLLTTCLWLVQHSLYTSPTRCMGT
jgi:hypothetical protein